MGLPMVQVFMIMARQMSKPAADMIMRYGKAHPGFRNRILIPVGRSIVHLTTRLRMKNLGLGAPTTVAPVSEATALDQASDLIQQIVIFGYSVGVFAGYYYYTKANEKETVSFDHLDQIKEDIRAFNLRLDHLERLIREREKRGLISNLLGRSQSEPELPLPPAPAPGETAAEAAKKQVVTSSIPFDAALSAINRHLRKSKD